MTFINELLKQTVTYWAPSSMSGWGGETFASPVAIDGRWEDKQELFIDSKGQEVRSNAVVYVDQDVDLGGFLYLGTSTASDPTTVDGAREIRAFQKSPNIKATEFIHKAWL